METIGGMSGWSRSQTKMIEILCLWNEVKVLLITSRNEHICMFHFYHKTVWLLISYALYAHFRNVQHFWRLTSQSFPIVATHLRSQSKRMQKFPFDWCHVRFILCYIVSLVTLVWSLTSPDSYRNSFARYSQKRWIQTENEKFIFRQYITIFVLLLLFTVNCRQIDGNAWNFNVISNMSVWMSLNWPLLNNWTPNFQFILRSN